MMNKIYIPALVTCTALSVNAQNVTHNHDATKKNQITVMETGAGSLTPSLYYSLLHGNYRKSAAAKNKMEFRTAAGLSAYQQIEPAASLDSAMIKRAEIEVLNLADRQIDLAWQVEGSKLTAQLQNYQRNINRIITVGGRSEHQRLWIEKYNVFTSAIKAIQQGYLPNSQRKNEYLKIYKDIVDTNDTLLRYIVQLNAQGQTAELLNASLTIQDSRANIALAAHNRWRESAWQVSKHD